MAMANSSKTVPAHLLSKEQKFKTKLGELGLNAVYKESTRQQYGVTQHRLEIRILRNQDEVCFTTGGFWDLKSYRESGFEQGLRRLALYEQTTERK